jgi:DNA-binding NarL/FixJ family response regulator
MRTVLLVGGDEDVSKDIAELLAYDGFHVVGRPLSSSEGIAYAENFQPEIIIVLSTRNLDHTDGLWTIPYLMHVARDTKVIVWSARDLPRYIERMLAAGVRAYVHKVVPYSEFLPILKAVADGAIPGYIPGQLDVRSFFD